MNENSDMNLYYNSGTDNSKQISEWISEQPTNDKKNNGKYINHIWFEIIALLTTAALKFIIMDWLEMRAFYIVGACLFWIIYAIIIYKQKPALLSRWGFQKESFRQSFIFLLPFSILCIIFIVIVGLKNNTVINWNIIYVLLLYPLWGLIQQFMVLGLIAANLLNIDKIKFKKYQVLLISSIIFSLVHYPNIFLMLFTFFMEIVFTAVYIKWRNIWALGLAHGWISTFLFYFIIERDLWAELFVWFL